AGFLPEQSAFTDTMRLPGTTAQAKKGKPNPEREDSFLTERYPFLGYAWFRREVHIPEHLRGKKMQLFLERTRITTVWINGNCIGSQNSLCTPHCYDLTAFSQAENVQITICVDNSGYPTKGGHMTSPDTQTNWNGITGEIGLCFFEENCITSVRVETDAQARTATFRMHVEGRVNMVQASGSWISEIGEVSPIPEQVLRVGRTADGDSVAVMKLGEDAPLWDEYTPITAQIRLRPYGSSDVTEVSFGLTDFRAEGKYFTNHGRPLMLRGKHDGMIFPLEGAAPTDVESWMRVMKIAKSYGINHYRFHTCTPPEAAFTAADRLGIFMEPEIPFWGSVHAPEDADYNAQEQAYLISEGRRILEAFGNHPSFCLFSLGNELWGSPERMGEILRYYKQKEHRILMTQGCNNFQFWPAILPEDDYFVGVRLSKDRLIRGSYGACDQPFGHVQAERPSTTHCYDPLIHPDVSTAETTPDGAQEIEIQYGTGVKKVRIDQAAGGLNPDKPVITHEIGQYVTYPNFDEIPKYTGVLEARNFELFRDRLDKAGMLAQWQDFFTCSGKLAVQCYKEELEAAMRSESVAGFQILDIQDFSGQGTALVGILDAFMDPKGTTTPEEWRGFCSDSVLLGLFPDHCLTNRLTMQVKLRHHAPYGIHQKLKYEISRGQNVVRKGLIDVNINGQGLFDLGTIDVEFPPASTVHRIDVTLKLPHTQNTYKLWQFPPLKPVELKSNSVCVTSDLKEALAKLESGGAVLFLPNELKNKVKGFYCADFWCYPMFRSISESMGKEVPVGTLGLCIEKRHPAVHAIRPERWSTPQWYDIVTNADLAILDGTPVKPIVQMIDNFERNHKLGLLFECRVGRGRLLVCTSRLSDIMERPEVRAFAKGLLDYVNSPEFQPETSISAERIAEILQG
ncbi:MAG: beta-glucuronidase, partial [Oscillospiraceae bacterium]|nr:beta-glucuronidase [Oscillospiraceae bacterium]